jgi:hypothetical protein
MRGRRAFVILTVHLVLVAGFALMIQSITERSISVGFGGSFNAAAPIGQTLFASLLLLQTLIVLVLHSCVGRSIERQLSALHADAELPPRMSVAYVKELSPAAPPPKANPPPATPPAAKPRRASNVAALPAQSAASAPEPSEEISPALEVAAAPDIPPLPPMEATPEPVPAPPPEPEAPPAPPAPPAAPEAPEAASTPSFNWPRSTRLSYVLRGSYRGELHGSAQVEWIRRDNAYQVFMDVTCGLIFERHLRSEGTITPTGLKPSRYQEKSKILFKDPRALSITFDATSVVLGNGQRVPTLPGVQDPASQFIQLTYLFRTQPERLAPGTRIELPVALPRHVNPWIFDVLPPEVLDTPIGRLQAYQLKPRRMNAVRPNDLKADIWFSPELQYLPVRIRIFQDENNYLDLQIAKKPEIGD